jgi:hypothetical protein
MRKIILNSFYSGVLFICSVSMTNFAQGSASYNTLTVYQNAGIGTPIDNNHPLTVTNQYGAVGAGLGPLYVKRTGTISSTGLDGGGTSWAFLGCDAGVRGYSYYGNVYSAGVGAWSGLDYTYCAALVAASTDGTTNTKLTYKDATNIVWPGYFTTPGANALQYCVGLRNPNTTDAGGSATGVLFSVDGSGEFGKGGIVYERKSSWARGSIHFLQEPNANSAIPGLGNKVMTITNGGLVGIGIEPTTSTARLQVEGDARIDGLLYCKELHVQTSAWADYVFSDSYKMKPLDEVEKYIVKNKHLPGIPSQQEVMEKGVNVVDMQTKMLKTMEELTLRVIELKKENDRLTEKMSKLESRIDR